MTTSQDSEEEEASTPSGGGGQTWEDIPVYPGANQVANIAGEIPPPAGDWSEMKWRYYETNDTVVQVADFYKSQMPNNGWEQSQWIDGGESMSFGFYEKSNGQDGAMIWEIIDGSNTFFALMRGWQ